jgi:hypothetical protein
MNAKANRIVWSEERKDWLKTWQPKLRRDVNRLTEQVSRCKQALPQFAQQAEDVARPALESGWQLLRLSWKNKFNPLSPEEAETQLSLVKEKFAVWTDFTRRSDISQAIAEVNKKVVAIKRARQEELRKAEQIFLARIETLEFQKSVEAMAAAALDQFKEMAEMARELEKYGTEEDLPVLQRLLLVQFVRSTYDFDSQIREAVSRFLSANPSPSPEDLLKCAIRSVIVETTKSFLKKGPRTLMPGVNDPKSLIATYQGLAFESLLNGMKEWKKDGVTPAALHSGFFTVQGIDFSMG